MFYWLARHVVQAILSSCSQIRLFCRLWRTLSVLFLYQIRQPGAQRHGFCKWNLIRKWIGCIKSGEWSRLLLDKGKEHQRESERTSIKEVETSKCHQFTVAVARFTVAVARFTMAVARFTEKPRHNACRFLDQIHLVGGVCEWTQKKKKKVDMHTSFQTAHDSVCLLKLEVSGWTVKI